MAWWQIDLAIDKECSCFALQGQTILLKYVSTSLGSMRKFFLLLARGKNIGAKIVSAEGYCFCNSK